MNQFAKTPLYDALTRHQATGRCAFHTPGHHGAVLPRDLFSLDLTELPDTDSLYEADGPIREAEREAERYFGTARTLFSAGGCTLCIQAMLRLAAPSGGEVVMGRVVHRSAVHAMALLDIQPVWVLPRRDAGAHLPGRVDARDVADCLKRHPDARAVYLTSPDYYGVMADIASIARVCRDAGVPLLVDNAHGAHLWLTSGAHPLSRGADMTACSAHKTLPVLTGGAWLHLREDRWAEDAKQAMALFGSTSPSYPVMASLDVCRAWMETEGRGAFARLERRVADVRRMAGERGFALPEGECDPVRLTLGTAPLGMSGEQAAEWLRLRGIEPEYADGAWVVLIPTPFHTEEEWARLEDAIRAFPQGEPISASKPMDELPPVRLSVRDAVLAASEWTPVERSVGRIAAQTSCPCPPGVPVVMPGEEITQTAAGFLIRSGISAVKVIK